MDQSRKIRDLLCPKECWVDDKNVSKCKGCGRVFILIIVWKHHCRFCGEVFCSDCVANVMTGESIGYDAEKRLRHCNTCRIKIGIALKEGKSRGGKNKEGNNIGPSISKIEIEDPDAHPTPSGEDRRTLEALHSLMNEHKINLQSTAISLLRQLAKELCGKYSLETATWELRLTEIAWKAVSQTKPELFIRREPFNLSHEIRVMTIITPTEVVAAVCVKGLVIQKNIPYKNCQTHLKYPRIVTVRPPIEADSLMHSKQVRFDEMVLNQDKILRSYLDSLFKLNPSIVFVQENVSKCAMQIALEKNVMIVSKMKSQDLDQIQRLALIKKRLDNLLYIDKSLVSEIIGCCERVYFKTVRQGETLLFVEHEAGLRTVLLGDTNEASNVTLKKVFDILIKAAWNLKIQRQILIRDLKLCPQNNNQAKIIVCQHFLYEKYMSQNNFLSSQNGSIFKMRYGQLKPQNLSKPFQQYIKLRGRKGMLQSCGEVYWLPSQFYIGEELSLGSFLLKCSIQHAIGCHSCNSQHVYRFYIDEYCITVSTEGTGLNSKPLRFSNLEEEEEKQRSWTNNESSRQNSLLHTAINKFIHAWKREQYEEHPRILFNMYFKCEECSKIVGNTKSRVGNDYLIMSLNHFMHTLTQAFRINEKNTSEAPTTEDQSCQHGSIVRVFQCPRTLVNFHIAKLDRYHLISIQLSEDKLKRVLMKDTSMVTELFDKMVAQKNGCIVSLEEQMGRLPFSGGMAGIAPSLSIAGSSAMHHSYFVPYMKIEESTDILKSTLKQFEQHREGYIEQAKVDWTVMMRRFSKIDHVIKASSEVILFILHALKKEKIEQAYSPQVTEDNKSLINFSMAEQPNRQSHLRKFSQHQKDSEVFVTKSQSIVPSSYEVFTTNRLRKMTSFQSSSQFDVFLRRIRNQRFLKYQGAYLYYPIANIEDAVSLLACCMNSDEFKQNLKEGNYRDNIVTRLQFLKELKTDWLPTPTVLEVYRELIKEEFYGGHHQDVEFSIFYHWEFEELRVSEGIDFKLYIRSLYGCQSWDSSGGKSNSTFSKAHNQTLVVKIINEKQFVEFQKFAPAYLKYMKTKRQSDKQSYLAKIYGIYQVIIKSQVYKCVVMQNIFFGLDIIGRVYDLKGSEVNRLAQPAGDKDFTRLDTNFMIDRDSCPYLLESAQYDKTILALVEDAHFLKDQGVIDYSLLAIESGMGLRMGIIDFMRPYHFVEKMETFYKQMKSGKDPTVIPPLQYAQRFVRAMKRYFVKSNKSQLIFDK